MATRKRSWRTLLVTLLVLGVLLGILLSMAGVHFTQMAAEVFAS